MMLTTSFALCHKHGACTEGYRKLAKNLGGIQKYGRNTPITLLQVLDSNGIEDAVWAFRAVPEEQEAYRDRIARLFGCDCSERVLHLYETKHPDDKRPRQAIETARRFAIGNATRVELAAAWDAARADARDAAWAAACAAACDAAWAAARAAAWAASRAAEREWQAIRLREVLGLVCVDGEV